MNDPHIEIANKVFENEWRVSFVQGQVKFQVAMTDLGELEIYTADGSLTVRSRMDNVIRIRREPTWDDETAIQVLANVIQKSDSPGKAAQECVNILRGRDR